MGREPPECFSRLRRTVSVHQLGDPNKTEAGCGGELGKVVATVGKRVNRAVRRVRLRARRGWDANNVTQMWAAKRSKT